MAGAPTLERLIEDPRVRVRNRAGVRREGACVVYWMQRAQRATDNPALELAVELGNLLQRPVVALLVLVPFPRANHRHYRFLAQGLSETAGELGRRAIGFAIRRDPETVEAFASEVDACAVVGDENPLRRPEAWRQRVARELAVAFYTVDADVIVPTAVIGREHWAAHTIRPRIHEQLARFLVRPHDARARTPWRRRIASLDPAGDVLDGLAIDRSVSPVAALHGGPRSARARLRAFLRDGLAGYAARRNRPELDGTSRLSPYLHFGHIGPRAIALAVQGAGAPMADREAFLEQLVVRRELAVNFVRYNRAYDRLAGCEDWARRTLAAHARDRRTVIAPRRLRDGESPDPIWNAAQRQMVREGWMHNFLRMYWAKRLLEWTRSAEEAFALAVELNDAFEVDGRDPNSYAGIAWAIGGKHDRAFGERPIFGKVRHMSPARMARKVAPAFVAKYLEER